MESEPEPGFPTESTQPPRRRADEAPGHERLIGGKYEIGRQLGVSEAGTSFHARCVADEREVRLLLLQPSLLVNPASYARLAKEVEASAGQRHPNLIAHGPIEVAGGASMLAFDWVHGFTLTSLLRARRKLAAPELLKLLPHFAAGLDFARQEKLGRLRLELGKIFVSFPKGVEQPEELLVRPFEQWPVFALKFTPVDLTPELDHAETWAGAMTIRPAAPPAEEGDLTARYVRGCASLIYELCGGGPVLMRGDRASIAPLASLTEASNEVLRRALEPGRTFATVQAFTKALAAAQRVGNVPEPRPGAAEVRPAVDIHATTPPRRASSPGLDEMEVGQETSAPRRGPASTGSNPPPPSERPLPMEKPPIAFQPPPPRRFWAKPVAIAAGVALLAAGGLTYYQMAGPSSTTPKSAAVIPKEKWDQKLKHLLDLMKSDETAPAAVAEMRELLASLRKMPPTERAQQIPFLRPRLSEAAKLGVIGADVLLADDLRLRDPAGAFQLYATARQLGDPAALVEMGRMFNEGLGTTVDEEKAITCFQEAAEKGSTEGAASLGECLLFGSPGYRNSTEGFRLVREAAAKKSGRALEALGTCYYSGTVVAPDLRQAADLYQQAIDAGEIDAYGSLGALVAEGSGVPADSGRAAALFRKGAEAGSPRCMYYYARALETGKGVTANAAEAEKWQKQAALAGYPDAQQWCRQRTIAYQ